MFLTRVSLKWHRCIPKGLVIFTSLMSSIALSAPTKNSHAFRLDECVAELAQYQIEFGQLGQVLQEYVMLADELRFADASSSHHTVLEKVLNQKALELENLIMVLTPENRARIKKVLQTRLGQTHLESEEAKAEAHAREEEQKYFLSDFKKTEIEIANPPEGHTSTHLLADGVLNPEETLIAHALFNRVLLHDLNGKLYADIRPFTKSTIQSIVFDPTGLKLFIGLYEGQVEVWDVAQKKHIKTLMSPQPLKPGDERRVTSLKFSPDGNFLISGAVDDGGEILIRDGKTFNLISRLPLTGAQKVLVDNERKNLIIQNDSNIKQLSINETILEDGTMELRPDSMVKISPLKEDEELSMNWQERQRIYQFHYLDYIDGTDTILVGRYSDALLWDLQKKEPLVVISEKENLLKTSWSAGARKIIITFKDRVDVYEPDMKTKVNTFSRQVKDDKVRPVNAIVYGSPEKLAVQYSDGILEIWDIKSGLPLSYGALDRVQPGQNLSLGTLRITKDGNHILSTRLPSQGGNNILRVLSR